VCRIFLFDRPGPGHYSLGPVSRPVSNKERKVKRFVLNVKNMLVGFCL